MANKDFYNDPDFKREVDEAQRENPDAKVIIVNNNTQPTVTKNKWVAAILAFLLGYLGIYQFYCGWYARGFIMLVITLVGVWFFGAGLIITEIWAIIDIFRIFLGSFKLPGGSYI